MAHHICSTEQHRIGQLQNRTCRWLIVKCWVHVHNFLTHVCKCLPRLAKTNGFAVKIPCWLRCSTSISMAGRQSRGIRTGTKVRPFPCRYANRYWPFRYFSSSTAWNWALRTEQDMVYVYNTVYKADSYRNFRYRFIEHLSCSRTRQKLTFNAHVWSPGPLGGITW